MKQEKNLTEEKTEEKQNISEKELSTAKMRLDKAFEKAYRRRKQVAEENEEEKRCKEQKTEQKDCMGQEYVLAPDSVFYKKEENKELTEKDYYKIEGEERQKLGSLLAKKDENTTERYYFWNWYKGYGWRQNGSCDGYQDIADLKKGIAEYMIEEKTPMRITKAEIIERIN